MAEVSRQRTIVWMRRMSLRRTSLLCAVAALTFPTASGAERASAPRAFENCAARSEASLSCIDLIPTPDLNGVSAILELTPAPSPFGVSVTVNGSPRQRLRATISGLPEARTLGNYTVFVAWAYTVALDSATKLGVVTNGRSELREINFNQFRILISAERSALVTKRAGKLVLRGTSPSTRLLAHRDFLVSPGMLRDDTIAATAAMPGMSHGNELRGNTNAWPMPPMMAGLPMMPGMTGLVPRVSPFRAGVGISLATLPRALPSTVVSLRNGDTLALDARLIRRSIGAKTFAMYGFNGQYPGPLISVAQGSTIVVQFENHIDQPSAVHWHGVRLENDFDGVPGVTQPLVQPGDRFTYRVHFRDAGVYWYHPHQREDIQQDLGLYGSMHVRSSNSNYYAPANREQNLLLDDLLVGSDGPTPHGAEAPTHALMGRFGNMLLVNGEPRYQLAVRRGEVVRFFLTNVSNARMFNVSFGGAKLKVVATDVGKFEREAWATSVIIAPAERYVVDVEFPRKGRVALVNRVQALDHMSGTYSTHIDTMGVVQVSADLARPAFNAAFATLRQNADVSAEIDPYRRFFAKAADHTATLTLKTRNLPTSVSNMLVGVNAPVDWNDGMPMMNWVTTGKEVTWVLRDEASGAENMDIAWRFTEGDIVKLRFVNDPNSSHAMQHPIHLHGQRFLVLARNGIRNDNLAWKDTAVIPAGEAVELLVEMSNPGRWMMHCHIAEHLGSGMMSLFTVAPKSR